MKQILCFGDSNTWGLDGETGKRFSWEERWTGILQEKLADRDIRIVEEGLCGRTTIFEDPLRLGRRGTELLPTLLETHTPDAVVLMLGTNDCKIIFGASAEIIGKGIARLLEQINQYADKMKVLVISPIYLGEKVWQDGYDQEFSPESVEVSKKLEPVYEKVAGKYGKRFMRAADYAGPSEADQEHMDRQSHKILADAIYRKLEAEIFCYLLDVTSATDFPVINSITVLLASIAVNTPARMKMAPRYPISVSFSCRKMKEKIAAKIGSRENRNPVFSGVVYCCTTVCTTNP